MAVNALGLPLLFQAGPGQIGDLFSGLQAGDTLRGRLIELVGQDQAVVSLRGQNLVAQLPPNSGLQKGDALVLQVGAFNPADLAKGAALTLRLLPAVASGAALGPVLDNGAAMASPGSAGRLEQVLNAAQLPLSSINFKVAETLSQLGAPLDRASLQAAAQATLALLGNENAGASAPRPMLLRNPGLQLLLQDGLAQAQVTAQFDPSSQNVLILQQAARALSQSLALGAASAPQPAPQPAPGAQDVAPVPASGATAGPPLTVAQAQSRLSQAMAALVAEPTAQGLQNLQQLLEQLAAAPAASSFPAAAPPANPAAPASGTTPGRPSAAPQTAEGPAGQAADSAATAAAAASRSGAGAAFKGDAALPSQREAMVQLLAALSMEGPLDPQAAIQGLAKALGDPNSSASLRLVAAVQVQQPGAADVAVLESARQALQQAGAALAAAGSAPSSGDLAALKSALQASGLPVPQANLSGLGGNHVAEAVAWLQARDLPPQRPLVETVATWISQDRNALPAAGRAVAEAGALPKELLQGRPALQTAVEMAQQAWQQAGVSPEHPGLASALSQWGQAQGLNLEAGLLAGADNGHGGHGADPAANGASGLRPSLNRLEGELRAAVQDHAVHAPGDAQRLGSALKEAQAAVQALNAVPLQAQAPPAFDTVHLPLPVWMNGQIAGGQLSVTWRQGRERELDEKEAVNVAVALNTESLGTVKVLLQVWKGSASARVLGETPEATAFLAQGAAELRGGFSERTPFNLQNLEFAVADAKTVPESSAPEAPSAGGLNLSA